MDRYPLYQAAGITDTYPNAYGFCFSKAFKVTKKLLKYVQRYFIRNRAA